MDARGSALSEPLRHYQRDECDGESCGDSGLRGVARQAPADGTDEDSVRLRGGEAQADAGVSGAARSGADYLSRRLGVGEPGEVLFGRRGRAAAIRTGRVAVALSGSGQARISD